MAGASEGDFLLAIDMLDETPILTIALAQAKTANLGTAAIVGSASFRAAQRAAIVIEVQTQDQSDNAPVVLAAVVHALGRALHWRYAEEFTQLQAKTEKTLKRLATAGAGKPR